MSDLKIYVACLASYNNGALHGAWIDVEGKDAAEIQEEVNTMLRASRFPNVTVEHPETGEDVPSAEEWAIHDHEGFGKLIEEYTSFEDVVTIAEGLAGDYPMAFRWLIEDLRYKPSDALDKAEDVSIFQSDRFELATAYAEEYVDQCYNEEDLGPLAAYIDYERFGRDLVLGGDVTEAEVDGERFLVTNASEF